MPSRAISRMPDTIAKNCVPTPDKQMITDTSFKKKLKGHLYNQAVCVD